MTLTISFADLYPELIQHGRYVCFSPRLLYPYRTCVGINQWCEKVAPREAYAELMGINDLNERIKELIRGGIETAVQEEAERAEDPSKALHWEGRHLSRCSDYGCFNDHFKTPEEAREFLFELLDREPVTELHLLVFGSFWEHYAEETIEKENPPKSKKGSK